MNLPQITGAACCGWTGRLRETAEFVIARQMKDRALWRRLAAQFTGGADDDGAWRGEFWGKQMMGAALLYGLTRDEELLQILEETVGEVLAAADGSGRISSYSPEKEFTGWDVWCRKYLLLGLQSFYGIRPDYPGLIPAMQAQADYMIARIGEGKRDITETTNYWRGLASSSVLEPVVRLYTLTGEDRYRDFAAYIIRRGGTSVADVFALAAEDIAAPYQYPITKAYEMISCFEGLLEYGLAVGERKYVDTAVKFARRVIDGELTVIGGAGCTHEYFDHAAARQTDAANTGLMQETCVTVCWMRFCQKLLAATGDPVYADCFEQSLYNAYLGAVNTGCVSQPAAPLDLLPFDSYSPLIRTRRGRGVGGHLTFSDGHCCGCCASIGGIGIGLVPQLILTQWEKGYALNLYIPGVYTLGGLTLRVDTAYPRQGQVDITLEGEGEFALALRIPGWSRSARLQVNGADQPVTPGYTLLTRRWRRGDRISLTPDMALRLLRPAPVEREVVITEVKWKENYMAPRVVIASPDARRYAALQRGPLVLAREGESIPALTSPADWKLREAEVSFPVQAAFEVTLPDGTAFTAVDYASAGKDWQTPLSCWLPVRE